MSSNNISPAEALSIPAIEESNPSRLVGSPLVSVLIITYNHEAYIEKAIEGVLQQRCPFPYEILIGEDASTDETRSVCLRLQKEYPDRIRIIASEANVGWQRNFLRVWHRTRGKYVALCEGDDYWTCPEKLLRQVQLLEETPRVVLCGGKSLAVTAASDGSEAVLYAFGGPGNKTNYTLRDLFRVHPFHTSTVVLRAGTIEFPRWFYDINNGDRTIYLLSASHGEVRMIAEIMSAYRIHPGGTWSHTPLDYQLGEISRLYNHFAEHFGPLYKKDVEDGLLLARWSYLRMMVAYNRRVDARRCFFRALPLALKVHPLRRVIITAFAVLSPSLSARVQQILTSGKRGR